MVKLGNHGPIYKDLSLFTGTLRRARVTVELLRQEMPNFLASNLWPPNSPYLSLVDYEIWAGSCLPQTNL